MLFRFVFFVVIIEAGPVSTIEGIEPGAHGPSCWRVGDRHVSSCRVQPDNDCATDVNQRRRCASTADPNTLRARRTSITVSHVRLPLKDSTNVRSIQSLGRTQPIFKAASQAERSCG